MDNLLRALAPIPAEAWELIDAAARRVLTVNLAARQLVDFTGPLGWTASSISLGPSIKARAIASICCSPPDKVPACWRMRSLRRGK